MANNIKVAIKVRPLIAREKKGRVEEQWTVTQNSIVSLNPLPTPSYHFDHVFGKESSNRDVFQTIAHPIVRQSLEGFNGTIFAYGQTSSGKTHTMLGNETDPGITVLAVRQLFEENESDRTFMIRVGYIEIYNEKVYDLLSERTPVTITQNGNDVKLSNKEVIVKDGEAILNILAQGNKYRQAAQTNMNEASSRSHAIFRIVIESEESNANGPVRVSFLNLVDLAGSEKANDAGTSGTRLKEGNDINKSLLHLGIAIRALSEGQKFVDVRSSKLTRILQASLGGNANTAIVCNITPTAVEETASTLGFANQAKTVKNEAKCNEVFTEEVLMKQMQAEIVFLKAQLDQSAEKEKKLRDEIEHKEGIFLTGKMMRQVKIDRRKTWHHMPGGDNSLPRSEIPKLNIRTGSLDKTPKKFVSIPIEVNTPTELKFNPLNTPSPVQAGLRYRLGRIEKEYSDLQQFTALEQQFKLHTETPESHVEKLEKELKIAREEIEKYRQLSYGKIAGEMLSSSPNGMDKSSTNGKETSVDNTVVLNELQAAKDQTNELIRQLAEMQSVHEKDAEKQNELIRQLTELQSVHEKDKENFDRKFKAATQAREKAEILQAEGEITFAQYKKQTNRRINELISEVETLKVSPLSKPVDLNISRMPIKVEPENSYERTEFKFEMDQLKADQERFKKTIESLQSKLESVTEERNLLKTESSESSIRNNEMINELKSQLEAMVEEKNICQSDNSALKTIEALELELKTITEERNRLQSEYTESATHNKTTTEELKSQLESLQSEKSEINARTEELKSELTILLAEKSDFTVRNEELQLQLESVQFEKSEATARIEELQSQVASLQSEKSEVTARYDEIIKKLESQLVSVTQQTTSLQSHHTELSSRNNDTIEDLQSQIQALRSEKSELAERCESINKDLESQLEAMTEERDALQSERSAVNDKMIEELELQVKTFTDELIVLQSDYSEVTTRYIETIKDLESKLVAITTEKNSIQSDQSESLCDGHVIKIKDLESQVQKISAEKCVIQSELEEVSASSSKTIKDLESKLETVSEEHSDMSTQIMDYIEELDEMKSKLDAMGNVQVKFDELQKIYDDNLQVIEKTEEECRTIKASLLESYDKIKISMEESESLKTKNSSLSLEVSNLKNSLNTQTAEVNDWKKRVQELQQQNEIRSAESGADNNLVDELEHLQKVHKNDMAEMEEFYKKLTDQFKKDTQHLQNELELQKKLLSDTSDAFTAEKTVLTQNLNEKQTKVDELQQTITELQSDIDKMEQHSNAIRNDLSTLKSELEEKQQLVIRHESINSDLKSKMNEMQLLINDYEVDISNRDKRFQSELSNLKNLLTEKDQLVDDNAKTISDLQSKFQSEISALQSDLLEKQQLIDSHAVVLSDLKSKLHSELNELKAELQGKKTIIENHDTVIATLKSELAQKFESKSLELKARLKVHQQQIDKYEGTISDLRSKFEIQLLEVKADVQLKQQQIAVNNEIIAKLQSDLNDKEKNELSAKDVIESLQRQLRYPEPVEPKKHSPKSAKFSVCADRKARRYSQHDESRPWLDETIEPPKCAETQTDPTDQNCGCESMNMKIIELKQQVAIKTAVVNTQQLKMDNHPLIGENKKLKKTLEDKQSEVDLLQMDVEHYKKKCLQAKKNRECSCQTRMMESKEVQVNCGTDDDIHQPNGLTNGNHEATNGASAVANGDQSHPNIFNLNATMQTYYARILPEKHENALEEIRQLQKIKTEIEKNKKELEKKSNFYKELAVSRRADIKKLEAKYGVVSTSIQPPSSNPTPKADK